MAKKPEDQEIKKASTSLIAPMPEYLTQMPEDKTSLELVKQYMTPPRLKVVQDMSKGEIKERFSPGDLVVLPHMQRVAAVELNEHERPGDRGDPIYLVILYFYPEWLAVNPIGSNLPFIRERTFDKNSALYRKCQTESLRYESHPDLPPDAQGKQQFIKNCEALNFIVAIIGEDQWCEAPTTLTYTRGEHRFGSKVSQLVSLRNPPTIYSCQWEARAVKRPVNNKGHQWWGVDIFNPSVDSGVNPWVPDAKRYEAYRDMHETLKRAHADKVLYAEYDETVDPQGAAEAGPAKF